MGRSWKVSYTRKMRKLALKLNFCTSEISAMFWRQRGPPFCDVRERSAILWRQRSPPCCDVREKSAMLWRHTHCSATLTLCLFPTGRAIWRHRLHDTAAGLYLRPCCICWSPRLCAFNQERWLALHHHSGNFVGIWKTRCQPSCSARVLHGFRLIQKLRFSRFSQICSIL